MTSVAEAFVTLRPDHQGFEGEAKRGILGPMKGLAVAIGAAFAAAGVGTFLKGAIDEAREAEKVTRLTEAVIKSTGGTAGVTAGHVSDLAEKLSNLAGVDDELIQAGENVLLTFTNIKNGVGEGNDVFDRATGLALDMSTALGTDLQGSVIQVGKALNDPIKGITALSRVGVSFTEDQKKMIATLVESGDTLGAQKVILDELGKEFGGAAAAASDPMQRLGVVVGNLKERVGTALLPIIEKAASWLGEKLPGALDRLGQVFGPIFDKISLGVSAFVAAFREGDVTSDGFVGQMERLGNFARDELLPIFEQVVAFFRDYWQPVLLAVGVVVLGLISPFALVVAAVGAAWVKFEVFRDVVHAVVDAVVGFWEEYREKILGVLTAVGDMFVSAFEAIRAVVETVLTVLAEAWNRFGSGLVDNLANAVGHIFDVLHGAITVWTGIFDLIKALLTGKWGEAWDAIKQILSGAWEELQGIIGLAFEALRVAVETAMGVVTGIWSLAWNGLSTFVSDLFDTVVGFVAGLPERIASAASGMWDGIKDAFRAAINWIIRAWNALEFTIPGFDPPGPGPKFGGFTLGVPDIPELHAGGTFRAPTGQGEGLALLRDREVVSTPESMADVVARLDALIAMVRRQTDVQTRLVRAY